MWGDVFNSYLSRAPIDWLENIKPGVLTENEGDLLFLYQIISSELFLVV